MDKIDLTILEILQKNARTPNTEIAKQLNMVPSAILERIRKLEKRGVIQRYKAIINPISLDLPLLAYVKIKCNAANWSKKCSEQLASIPKIEELHEVLGKDSYLAKIRAKDMDDLSTILKKDIGKIPEIKETQTVMVTKTIKENSNFPINKKKIEKGVNNGNSHQNS